MTSIEQIRSLTAWDVTIILGTLLATIAPGLLIIYLYEPMLVEKLESLKLFALSASITLPVIAANAFIISVLGPFVGSIGKGDNARKHVFFWVSIWTSISLYMGLLLAYLCHFNVTHFMAAVSLIDVLFGLVILSVMRSLVQATS
jgi:hypothetical protein